MFWLLGRKSDLLPYRWMFPGIFCLKSLVAIIYIFLHEKLIQGGDIFTYMRDAEALFELAFVDFEAFSRLVFGPANSPIPEHMSPRLYLIGYWTDPSAHMIVRFHTIMYFLSNGNVYVHGVFAAAISSLGILALIRSWKTVSENYNSWIPIMLILFPGILFWGSGIHKEFLWIFLTGLFSLSAVKFTDKSNWKWLIPLIGSFYFLFILRDFSALILLNIFVCWHIFKNYTGKRLLIGTAAYWVLSIGVSMFLPLQGQDTNLIDLIIYKQDAFESLNIGNTHMEVPEVQSFINLATKWPIAFAKSIASPIFPIKGVPLSIFLFLENILLIIILIISLRQIVKGGRFDPWSIQFFIGGIILLIICGFVVPNLGAMSRYRIMGLVFLLPSLVSLWNNLYFLISK